VYGKREETFTFTAQKNWKDAKKSNRENAQKPKDTNPAKKVLGKATEEGDLIW
jgi:hypothetical protein